MGHKILRGERKLTVAHVKKLAAAFHLSPSYFIAYPLRIAEQALCSRTD